MGASKQAMDSRLEEKDGIEFLLTELRTGLTFARVALGADPFDTDKKARNRDNARTAYNTVLKFRPRVKLSDSANQALEAELHTLRAALRELGEPI